MSSDSTPASAGDEYRGLGDDNQELMAVAEVIAILRHWSNAAAVEFDPVFALEATRRAFADHPGPVSQTWFDRLRQAGRELGLRVARVHLPVAEAISVARPDVPLVALESSSRHVVLSGKWWRRGRLAALEEGQRDSWVHRRTLALRLGVADPWQPVEFVVAHPAYPAEGIVPTGGQSDAAQHGGGGHHAAGHGGSGHGGHGDISPAWRLWRLLRPEWGDLATLMILAITAGIMYLAVPLTIDALVSFVAFGGLLQPLLILTVVLFVALLAGAAVRLAQVWIVEILQRRLFARVAVDLAYRLPRVRPDAWDGQNGPETINRFLEIVTIQKAASVLLLDGINLVLSALVGLTVLAFYHPLLLAFAVFLIIAAAVIVFGLGRRAVTTAVAESRSKYAMLNWLEEIVRHPGVFHTVGGADTASTRADRLVRQWLDNRSDHFSIVVRQTFAGLMLQVVASTSLLALGGWLVIGNQLTLGQLVAAEIIVGLVVSQIAKMGKYLETWYDLMAAVDKLGHLFALPVETDCPQAQRPQAVLAPADGGHREVADGRQAPLAGPHDAQAHDAQAHDAQAHDAQARRDDPLPHGPNSAEARRNSTGLRVELIDVGFGYDHYRPPLLEHFRLVAQPGSRVAIVGPTGSGNSTLLALMAGFREPHHGRIELDGLDLKYWPRMALRNEVYFVGEPAIIEGSVAENIRMGRPELSLVSVRAALESVGLWQEILNLPGGLNARLVSGGWPLSSGQARRLTLARALAARPRLLLLDGIVDQLALPAQRVVMAGLEVARSWTTVVMTTRKDHIINACDARIQLAETSEGTGGHHH